MRSSALRISSLTPGAWHFELGHYAHQREPGFQCPTPSPLLTPSRTRSHSSHGATYGTTGSTQAATDPPSRSRSDRRATSSDPPPRARRPGRRGQGCVQTPGRPAGGQPLGGDSRPSRRAGSPPRLLKPGLVTDSDSARAVHAALHGPHSVASQCPGQARNQAGLALRLAESHLGLRVGGSLGCFVTLRRSYGLRLRPAE